jgi:hypothetical protein
VLTGDASPVGFVFPEVPLVNTMTSQIQFGPEPLPFISTPEMTTGEASELETFESMSFFFVFFVFFVFYIFIYVFIFVLFLLITLLRHLGLCNNLHS